MSTFQILHQSHLLADGQGQHQCGVPCPQLFSGTAWVTGIRALLTGGGTTQMSPASRGAGTTGKGRSWIRMWMWLGSGSRAAFLHGTCILTVFTASTGPDTNSSHCRRLAILSSRAVGAAVLEGACGGVLQAQGPPEVVSSRGRSENCTVLEGDRFGKQSILEI